MQKAQALVFDRLFRNFYSEPTPFFLKKKKVFFQPPEVQLPASLQRGKLLDGIPGAPSVGSGEAYKHPKIPCVAKGNIAGTRYWDRAENTRECWRNTSRDLVEKT